MNPKRRMPYSAARRRSRKATVAARDGAHCAYCRRPFTNLAHATMDHVIPYRLFPTWNTAYLVLACHDCNQTKADTLPLPVALALLATVGRLDTAHVGSLVPTLARLTYARTATVRADRTAPDQPVRPVRHPTERSTVRPSVQEPYGSATPYARAYGMPEVGAA